MRTSVRVTTLALSQQARRGLASQWDIPSVDELEQRAKAAARQTLPIENVQGTFTIASDTYELRSIADEVIE